MDDDHQHKYKSCFCVCERPTEKDQWEVFYLHLQPAKHGSLGNRLKTNECQHMSSDLSRMQLSLMQTVFVRQVINMIGTILCHNRVVYMSIMCL